jgi:ATP-dependent Lon protease
VAYAVECRRRVKEQMNKRKPDDEFAHINLSYFKASGGEIIVYCPESKDAIATQEPARRRLRETHEDVVPSKAPATDRASREPIHDDALATPEILETPKATLKEQHFTILYGDTGHSYETIIGPYLQSARSVVVEDPYIRLQHQIQNFVRFCETLVKAGTIKKITLITGYDDKTQLAEIAERMEDLKQSLIEVDIELDVKLCSTIHDREIRLDNGWVIKIGRGLDFYQKPGSWFEIGTNDLSLRKCLETKVDIYKGS